MSDDATNMILQAIGQLGDRMDRFEHRLERMELRLDRTELELYQMNVRLAQGNRVNKGRDNGPEC